MKLIGCTEYMRDGTLHGGMVFHQKQFSMGCLRRFRLLDCLFLGGDHFVTLALCALAPSCWTHTLCVF